MRAGARRRNLSMLPDLQYRVLTWISPGAPDCRRGNCYDGKSKLALFGEGGLFAKIAGKCVIDFGCGEGLEALDMVRNGARRVIGIDIREDVLENARRRAASAGLQDRCIFASSTEELADVVVSLDAFEHFADPAAVLRAMALLLRPDGEALISFGPTWYHPWGGHFFSIFPWAHLLFRESALLQWRSTFKADGATRFGEVAGGLNQMTIARFEALVAASPLVPTRLELVPIRKLRRLHNRWTREWTTAIVRCRLVQR